MCHIWSETPKTGFLASQLIYNGHIVGPVALSTPCKLIAPGVAISGLMSITKTDLYFEMDEDDEGNKKIDPKVGHSGRSNHYYEISPIQ